MRSCGPAASRSLVVHAVGEHQHQPVAAGDAAQHLLALERPLRIVQVELERALELLAHAGGKAPRREYSGPHGVHGLPVCSALAPDTINPILRSGPGSGPNGGPAMTAVGSDCTGTSAWPPAGTQTDRFRNGADGGCKGAGGCAEPVGGAVLRLWWRIQRHRELDLLRRIALFREDADRRRTARANPPVGVEPPAQPGCAPRPLELLQRHPDVGGDLASRRTRTASP